MLNSCKTSFEIKQIIHFTGSRPTSAKPSSRPASGKAGSRPTSAKPDSRPASGKAGSRPVSAKSGGSARPASGQRSGRGSAAENKPPSPELAEQSAEQQFVAPEVDKEQTGETLDRPASAGSKKDSRPVSAGRPQSASRELTQEATGGIYLYRLKQVIPGKLMQ